MFVVYCPWHSWEDQEMRMIRRKEELCRWPTSKGKQQPWANPKTGSGLLVSPQKPRDGYPHEYHHLAWDLLHFQLALNLGRSPLFRLGSKKAFQKPQPPFPFHLKGVPGSPFFSAGYQNLARFCPSPLRARPTFEASGVASNSELTSWRIRAVARQRNELAGRVAGVQGCQGTYLCYRPWKHEPILGLLMFILSPKGVYTPYKISWKPGKPRGMNKGYVLPPLDGGNKAFGLGLFGHRLNGCECLPGPFEGFWGLAERKTKRKTNI